MRRISILLRKLLPQQAKRAANESKIPPLSAHILCIIYKT